MGTIVSRRRKDGSLGYTAQIRIHRQGKCIHSESETFDRRQLATEWMRRREAELDQQRARGEPVGKAATLTELLEWYGKDIKELTPWGRTKEADLKRLASYEIAKKNVLRLTTADYIAHVEDRRRNGAGPATAGNDLIWLRQVLRSARASLSLPIDLQLLEDATHELRQRRVTSKPKERQRRVTATEEKTLLDHFAVRDVRAEIPMADIIRFALLTARRQEEITRLKWADLDREKGIAWLDDVKHPRKKVGNRRAFRLLSEAWEIIDRQPVTMVEGPDGKSTPDPRVFPYNPKSIGANFTRATRLRGQQDLHFHDLRHEATSRLFERGYDIPEVAQFTLHESWTTLKRYTTCDPSTSRNGRPRLPPHDPLAIYINTDIIMPIKPVEFLGDSLDRLREFPNDAKQDAGYQLDRVQHGLQPDDFKPMPSIGKGVEEIRVEIRVWDDAGTYRVIYTARLADAVYVLHAFQKKTQATSKRDIELAKQRFAQLIRKQP